MSISPNRSLSDVNPSSALLWADFKTQFDVNGVRKCNNLGRYPGAPKYLTMGDGTTASTFPTQLVGRHGISLDGGDYIDTGIVDPFERTDRFTIAVVCSALVDGNLCDTFDQAVAYRGFGINMTGGVLYHYIISNYGTSNMLYRAVTSNAKPIVSYIDTYDGSSTRVGHNIYYNANLVTTGNLVDMLSSTIKSGKSYLFGAWHNGAAKGSLLTGNIHNAFIFPWELTAQQVQYLHRYCVTRINQS